MPRWCAWAVSLAVVALDQGTKAWVSGTLAPGQSQRLLGDVLGLVRVHNPGAAFGLFPQGQPLFLATSLGVALALVAYLLWVRPRGLRAWGSAFLLGGAVGNLIDRVRWGYILDFLALGGISVFNVADAALVLGVGLLVLGLVRGPR